jgi:hypothetical protein
MARIQPGGLRGRSIIRLLLLAGLILMTAVNGPVQAQGRAPLRDAPVIWYADDDRPIPLPAFHEPGLVPYSFESFVSRPFSRFFHPGRLVRNLDSGYAGRRAPNVNSLDEVINSTWFTNRVGLYDLSLEDVATGPGLVDGPDRSAPWVIVGAKTAGVTPGFRIQDGQGDVWLLKFDPPSHPGMTIRSGVVCNLIYHALGYNVPVDRVVVFDRDDLVVGEGAMMKLPRVGEIPMTEANLDSVLQATNSIFDGHYQALASKYLSGEPLGPFSDQGRRKDDPNDTVKHQDRRELRALKVFGAWVNHFDTKMHNSLDMYVGQPGQGYVKHYLIDFASTLGAFGDEPVKRFGYEFGLDLPPMLGRSLALGFHEDPWVKLERPEGLAEVGLFQVDPFEPNKWKPDLPHSAMANLTAADGYWAAKALSGFTPDHIRAMVGEAYYQDPRAAEFVVEVLRGRQEKIVRYWFVEVPPLDFFQPAVGVVRYTDLAVARGFFPGDGVRYQYRLCSVDSNRQVEKWGSWTETDQTEIPLAGAPATTPEFPFLVLECQVDRGQGWSSSIKAYLAPASGRIVAVDR